MRPPAEVSETHAMSSEKSRSQMMRTETTTREMRTTAGGQTAGARARRLLALIVAAATAALLGPALIVPATGLADEGDEHYMLEQFDAGVWDRADNFVTQAGAHPDIANTYFLLQRTNINASLPESGIPVATLRNVEIDLPAGLVVNPQATEQCTRAELWEHECPPASQVGKVRLNFNAGINNSVYNMVPRKGLPAEFAFVPSNDVSTAAVYLEGHVHSDGRIMMRIPNNSAAAAIAYSDFDFYGIPADPANGTDANGNLKALITNPTSCTGPVETIIRTNAWSNPAWDTLSAPAPAGTDCDLLPFTPSAQVSIGNHTADSPTPMSFEVRMDQSGITDPNVLPQAHLKRVQVELPEGMAVNPAAANGLKACSPEQIGLGSDEPAQCPDASKIGTVEIETPLLKEKVDGAVYLAEQNNNPFNELLALYLVPKNTERGLELKLPGKVEADPETGQLTATFDDNPQLPFSKLSVHFFGGKQGAIVNPPTCGEKKAEIEIAPWSAADVDNPTPEEMAYSTSKLEITKGANGHPCPETLADRPFDPDLLSAGLLDNAAASSSAFVMRLQRHDGDQELDRLTLSTPEGLSAVLKNTAQCDEDSIAADDCPANSRVGQALVSAGAGSEPYWVRDGQVYLAGPYDPDGSGPKEKAPLSLDIQVPAVAGPFDLGMVNVRAAIYVHPRTAALTVVSDPMPQILEGIPLRVKELRIRMDKPGFMVAPTNCSPMSVAADVYGINGGESSESRPFQVDGCSGLQFDPKLKLAYKGKGAKKRNSHPRLLANLKVPQPAENFDSDTTNDDPSARQANLDKVRAVLPKGTYLDQDSLSRVCTPTQWEASDCPADSKVGDAKAWSPLLAEPLTGPVYLKVSDNVLPDLAADLHGIVDLDLFGKVDQSKGRIRNTFQIVPDVPVSKFQLNITGGKGGLLVNSKNICKGKKALRRANVNLKGQNGAKVRGKQNVVRCGKKK